MEKEKVEHELVSSCLDYLLTLKVERKNYIEILNTIERRFAESGKTNPNSSLFLMFTSGKKSDLVIGGQDVPEMSDLYRVTLDRKGYNRDEMWGDLDALWRLGITTITRVGTLSRTTPFSVPAEVLANHKTGRTESQG
jgi:hypothetical protein